jgi:hypothetical protein
MFVYIIGYPIKRDMSTESLEDEINTRAKIIKEATGTDLIATSKGAKSSFILLYLYAKGAVIIDNISDKAIPENILRDEFKAASQNSPVRAKS